MTKILKIILNLGLILGLLITGQNSVQGQEYIEDWQKIINTIEESKNFQVLMNYYNDQGVFNFNADNDEDTLRLFMEYINEEGKSIQIDLYMVSPYQIAYINLADILMKIDGELEDKLMIYEDFYTPITLTIKPVHLEDVSLADYLIYSPNLTVLKDITSKEYQVNQTFFKIMKGPQNHPNLFFQQGNFTMDLELVLNRTQKGQLNIDDHLTIDLGRKDIAFQLEVLNLQNKQYQFDFDFQLKNLQDRLIKTSLMLDKSSFHYSVKQEGLKDAVDLNINSSETAEYWTSQQSFSYQIEGLSKTLVDLSELKILSIDQIEVLINQ